MRACSVVLLTVLAVSACGPQAEESATRASEPVAATANAGGAPAAPAGPETRRRLADLAEINDALQQYHSEHGAYPVSDEWQGYASAWGASLGEDWIPELDAYLPDLPRDPTQQEDPQMAQYLYRSDGMDYKLIAHRPMDCSEAINAMGVRVDPVRTYGEVCEAYGYWSRGGEAF